MSDLTRTANPNKFFVVTGQPGAGKTKNTIRYFLKKGKKVLFLSRNHSLLRELKERYPEIGYWRGAVRLCENPKLKRILELGISPSYVCPLCTLSKCEYKSQFDFSKRFTVAPLEYIHTSYPEKLNPDVIILDDVIEETSTLPPLKTIRRWLALWVLTTELDLELGKPLPKEFYKAYQKVIKSLVKEKELKGFEKLFTISPATYKKVIQRLSQYRDEESELVYPILLELKDSKAKVVVVGSNKDILQLYREQYGLEFKVLELRNSKTNSRIVRLGSGWYPLQSLRDKRVLSRISRDILKIVRKETKTKDIKKIGIISYKAILPRLNFVSRAAIEKEHFQNLKGINRLEDCDLCFVVGSYVSNVGELQKKYAEQFGPADFSSKKCREGGYRYKDKKVETYRRCTDDEEQYQAIHRFRPGIRDATVYVFGLVPHKIREEFEVKDETTLPKSMLRKDALKRFGRKRIERWVREGKLTKKYVKQGRARICILERA
ncbi:MAG: hypothetical protein ACTSP1_04120 [Candidatus Freyarchaeota archaeon]